MWKILIQVSLLRAVVPSERISFKRSVYNAVTRKGDRALWNKSIFWWYTMAKDEKHFGVFKIQPYITFISFIKRTMRDNKNKLVIRIQTCTANTRHHCSMCQKFLKYQSFRNCEFSYIYQHCRGRRPPQRHERVSWFTWLGTCRLKSRPHTNSEWCSSVSRSGWFLE